MRWCSKFEKSGITSIISTEQRGSFREAFEATLNEDPDNSPKCILNNMYKYLYQVNNLYILRYAG